MQSLFSFIVKPVDKRYDNEVKVGSKTLITNSRIESWKSVSNQAVVLEVPNFRRFYDIRGNQKDSRSKFIDDKFFCDIDQVYLYKQDGEWNAFGDRCFINPILDSDDLTADKERKLIGILKYGNSSLEAVEINPGDLVGYTPNGEFEFVVDNERLYCMKSNDIVIKYEYEGNETKYNPSWASGSSRTD
jgi:hypothetical protein